MRALRERGVLRGFHAEVDLAALGRPLQAMIAVRLAAHTREQIEDFTAHVRELPGVLSVFHMTGATDYLLWVAAADAQDLREFVVDHLATTPRSRTRRRRSSTSTPRAGPACRRADAAGSGAARPRGPAGAGSAGTRGR